MQYGRLIIDFDNISRYIMKCPCCGSEMKKERDLKNSVLMKCVGCGISDTVVKS